MRWGQIGKEVFRLVVCVAAVFTVTAVLYKVPLHDRSLAAAFSFLFLVLIVPGAWGFRYALFVSLLAALGFSWLLPPVGRFWLSDPRDVFTLAGFLIIGIVASHLSGRARREAVNSNQRRTEAVAAQQRFRDLVNSVDGIVWEADAQNFVFSFVSEQVERILGYSPEQWLREPTFWKDHLHPEDRDWAVQLRLQATGEKRSHDFECRMIAADGCVVWLRDLVTVVVENGRATRLRGVMVDLTKLKQAEQARREIEEQWRAAFESNPAMYFVVDAAGAIVSVNDFGAEQLGYAVNELVGQPVSNVFYQLDRDAVQSHANACFNQLGRMMRWEARKIRKDGTMLWVREKANAVLLRNRPVLLVVCEDITEQKRAEEALRASELSLRLIVDSIPGLVNTTTAAGEIELANQQLLDYVGMTLEELRNWRPLVHPDDCALVTTLWSNSVERGHPYEDEHRLRRADGVYRWFHARGLPLRDKEGRIVRWYVLLTDIEDRKRAENLFTGEKRILEMVTKGESLAHILDSLCRLVEEQATGVLASVLLVDGKCLRHGGAPSLPKAYIEAIDGVEIGPSVGSCGTAAYRREQVIVEDIATDPLWADYRDAALPHSLRACWSTPIFSSQGEVIATFAMYYRESCRPGSRDQEIIEQITHLAGAAIQRKLTQEALLRNEAYLAEAQRLSKTGSWAYNPANEKAFYWSDEMFRIFGLDPRTSSPPDRQQFVRLMHPEDRDRFAERVEKAFRERTEFTQDYRIVLPDGAVKHLHEIGHPVLDESGNIVEYVGTEMDVTERKRAEEDVRAAETRFRASVDHLTDALFIHDDQDDQGRVIDANQQACDSLGYTREELIGMTEFDYDALVDATFMRSIKERLACGEMFSFESVHRRKDGTTFPVEVRVRPFWHGDHRFGLALARDITDRKRVETERERLRQLEADLQHINRVSMMGELTASLAHEIKQPIAAAVSNAEACLHWLARDKPDFAEMREAATEMVKEARRAAEIVTRIRALFKKEEIRRELLDLNEVITETVSLIRAEADRRSISVRTELDAELSTISADRVQLQQVLMNLMLNGIEAMNGSRGELIITSQRDHDGLPLISVSDTGVGLPADKADRIFAPFFTTKPQGTGMGLAITRSIIEAHWGRLWATPNPDRGATFHFTLPTETASRPDLARNTDRKAKI